MSIVTLSADVTMLLKAYYTPVLDWVSEQVYEHLLRRDAQHVLVRLHAQLDTAKMEAACREFHHADGPGAPAAHPVARLVRALLVGALFNWSLRQLEWHIRYNLIVKWFVGYPLYADGPDHSTLERFEQWVCVQQHRMIFDEVLRQIDAQLPGERESAQECQVGDTYALRANAAKEPLLRLIRHACQRLLAVLTAADPGRAVQVRAQLDAIALFGAPNERREYYLTDAERAVRLRTTVLAALDCIRLVQAQREIAPPLLTPVDAELGEWIAHVRKIIADETVLNPPPPVIPAPIMAPSAIFPTPAPPEPAIVVPPAAPAPLPDQSPVVASPVNPAPPPAAASPVNLPAPQEIERSQPVKGAYRLGSATDPDATYRVHGAGKSDLGYNVNLLVSKHFVRDTQVTTGAQPDASILTDMLQTQSDLHQLFPSKVIYDMAAGTGKMRHLVALASHHLTQLVAALPLTGRRNRSHGFGPEHFALSANGLALTCPNHVTSVIAYRSGSGDGRDFRFLSAQCRNCPLCSQCRPPASDSAHMRLVFISDYRPEVEAARLYNSSTTYQADMKQRFVVEQSIAALVRHNGGRRARRCGLLNADFQAKMNATAFNLKRWVCLTANLPPVA
jgi:IS5 family transposase